MRLYWTILLLFPFLANSQSYFKDHFGGTIGLVANVGSHVTNIGLNVKGYYTDYFYQFNLGSTFYLHQHSYANRQRFWETRNTAGLVLLAGKKNREIDFYLDGLNHQTSYSYGIGYNYILYHDKVGTSQRSGGMSIHIKNFSLLHENDMFAGQAKDRFRTARVEAAYQHNDFRFATGINLWTGETSNTVWQRVNYEKCPSGFRILEDRPYGKTSHGIAYAGITYNTPFKGQNLHLKLGADSEAIRHGIQNRFIHDLIFLPKKIERTTPHYPRLDEYGCPVFSSEDARKTDLFLQFGMNDNWSN